MPEAIINYIALLGWNPGTEEEIFSLDDLKKIFTVERLNRSPAIFDITKLTWMNGCYIRALSPEKFHKLASPYYQGMPLGVDQEALSRALQPRVETLGQIAEQTDFIRQLPDYSLDLYTNKKMKTDANVAKEVMPAIKEVLSAQQDWSNDALFESLKALAEKLGVKNGQVLYPARIALSGKETTPGGATELAVILGKEESLRRIDAALAKL